jgi:diguanylate cyclase (GGDEF)-like protein/PAS domain S-box-containing protein
VLGHYVPLYAIGLEYLVAGVALVLGVQHLLARRLDPTNAVALWFAASGTTLAAALGADVWLFTAPVSQVDLAMLVRAALGEATLLVLVPTLAAFASRGRPKWGFRALVAVIVVRTVLWQATGLVYTHRIGTNHVPLYGPLSSPFDVLMMLLSAGIVIWMARGWQDRVERVTFVVCTMFAIGITAAFDLTAGTPTSDVLNAFWIAPLVIALQVLFARRTLKTDAAVRAALAQVARTERRSRLALESGGMGWFDYDPATREVHTSPELAGMLGLAVSAGPTTIDSVLAFFHPTDRPQVQSGLGLTEAQGRGTAEARWERPDGTTLWLEMSALMTALGGAKREVVGVMKDITERKRAEAELLDRARHDQLTGLPNRATLTHHVRGALRRREGFSLLLMDLDGFKDINDTLGHPVGDQVLVAVAKRLASGLRRDGVLARSGGDEFALLVPETGRAATDIAGRLLMALREPVEVDGVAITVRASLGVVCAPEDGGELGTLLRRAELAMYIAKRHDNRVYRYQAGDDRGAARRLQLAGQLPTALTSEEVEVYYQPTIELASGRCELLEALVRWRHPRFGLVPPAEFVPLAEQYGLGFQLLRRVLSEALAQCTQWREQDLARSVAVNVSPRTLLDPAFLAFVTTELARARLPSEALVIEITEDAFAGDGPGARNLLDRLNDIGVRTAIDDFGTGYSSLAYLKALPVSTLKLDRSFIAGLGSGSGDDAIVSLAIDLGHQFGLNVVGEGVETATQFEALRAHGCDAAQGYWMCRPGPASTITGWLADNTVGEGRRSSRHLRAVSLSRPDR